MIGHKQVKLKAMFVNCVTLTRYVLQNEFCSYVRVSASQLWPGHCLPVIVVLSILNTFAFRYIAMSLVRHDLDMTE